LITCNLENLYTLGTTLGMTKAFQGAVKNSYRSKEQHNKRAT